MQSLNLTGLEVTNKTNLSEAYKTFRLGQSHWNLYELWKDKTNNARLGL